MLGVGVMINMLGGNSETVDAHNKAVGKTIKDIKLKDNAMFLDFTDGTGIMFEDDGQSCCEVRYMNCDDDLSAHKGAEFKGAEIRTAEEASREDEWGEVHEIQFLLINTSEGVITVANHNEHNGYYGGFWIIVKETKNV